MDQEQIERIGKITTNYYRLPECIPTQENYALWIESLEEPMKSVFADRGMGSCVGVLSYRRFILELNDVGMDEYLRKNLTAQDYHTWRGLEG